MNSFAPPRQVAHSFIAYPFRIYFLLSSLCLITAAWAWGLFTLGALSAPPLSLHAHLFLNIGGGAAFAGFLFTAMPEWSRHTAPLNRHSLSTLALWLAACTALLHSPQASAWQMLPFWLYLLLFCSALAYQSRDSSHLSLLLVLLLIVLLNAGFAHSGDPFWLKQQAHAFIIGILLIVFRIGKAIGQKALEHTPLAACVFMPNPFYRNLSATFLYLYILAETLLNNPAVSAWLSLATGLALIGRLREWHYRILLRQYYIRWYYLTLLLLGAGYIWQAWQGLSGNSSTEPFHLIMIGGYLLMLMQVFAIAGAVHSSLALHYPRPIRLAMLLIAAAACSRALLTNAFPQHYPLLALYLPALLLTAAFAIYLPLYTRIFIANPPLPVDAEHGCEHSPPAN